MTKHIFLSYSSKEIGLTKDVCAFLEKNDLKCWMAPRDIVPGAIYAKSIIDAINSAGLFVLLYTHNSNTSEQVLKEVDRAVNARIPIIPFCVEEVTPGQAMEYYLCNTHWLNAHQSDPHNYFGQLLESCRDLLHSCASHITPNNLSVTPPTRAEAQKIESWFLEDPLKEQASKSNGNLDSEEYAAEILFRRAAKNQNNATPEKVLHDPEQSAPFKLREFRPPKAPPKEKQLERSPVVSINQAAARNTSLRVKIPTENPPPEGFNEPLKTETKKNYTALLLFASVALAAPILWFIGPLVSSYDLSSSSDSSAQVMVSDTNLSATDQFENFYLANKFKSLAELTKRKEDLIQDLKLPSEIKNTELLLQHLLVHHPHDQIALNKLAITNHLINEHIRSELNQKQVTITPILPVHAAQSAIKGHSWLMAYSLENGLMAKGISAKNQLIWPNQLARGLDEKIFAQETLLHVRIEYMPGPQDSYQVAYGAGRSGLRGPASMAANSLHESIAQQLRDNGVSFYSDRGLKAMDFKVEVPTLTITIITTDPYNDFSNSERKDALMAFGAAIQTGVKEIVGTLYGKSR